MGSYKKKLLDYFSTPKVLLVIVIKYKTNAHSLKFFKTKFYTNVQSNIPF